MITITFNAFSFLRARLDARGIQCGNAQLEVAEDMTIEELIAGFGLGEYEVEGVLLNGRIVSRRHKLEDGDRLALVPPGTPGPYRVLLGMKKAPSPGP